MYNLYLFKGEKYMGYFDVYGPFDMVYHDECLYDEYGVFHPDLETKEGINNWLSERIIPDERPDKCLVITKSGFSPGTSDWEILLEGHCTSFNDIVWWSKEKDPSWYMREHWYPCLNRELRSLGEKELGSGK